VRVQDIVLGRKEDRGELRTGEDAESDLTPTDRLSMEKKGMTMA